MPFLLTFPAKIVKVEHKTRALSAHKTGIINEDGTANVKIEYEDMGWFVQLERSWESLYVGMNKPDLETGQTMVVTMRAEVKHDIVEALPRKPYPIALPNVAGEKLFGYFVWQKCNGVVSPQKIGREIYETQQNNMNKWISETFNASNWLSVKLDEAEWALSLAELANKYPCPENTDANTRTV